MSDFTIDNINIAGVPGYVQIEETTSQTLFDKYKEYIDQINTISNLPSPTAAQKKQLQDAINGLRNILTDGMVLPIDSSNPNSIIKRYYMTPDMVTSVEVIFSSLKLVGVDVAQSINFSDTQLSDWGGLVKSGGILNGVVTYVQGLANIGIQRFIEIVIVKDANDKLDKSMGDLQAALDVTKRVMETIKSLQEMQNNISFNLKDKIPESAWKGDIEVYKNLLKQMQENGIQSFVPFNYTIDDPDMVGLLKDLMDRARSDPLGGLINFGTGVLLRWDAQLSPEMIQKYNIKLISPLGGPQRYYIDDPAIASKFQKLDQLARAFVHPNPDPNVPTIQFSGGKAVITPGVGSDAFGEMLDIPGIIKNGAQEMINNMIALREKVSKNIEELLRITPKLADGTIDPNSLVGRLQKVLDDLNSKFATLSGAPIDRNTPLADAWGGMLKWVTGQEDVQQNLSYAITAGQSLNERQKEDVRQAIYIYEQLVKMTASLIESVQQLYIKPLQGIGRG